MWRRPATPAWGGLHQPRQPVEGVGPSRFNSGRLWNRQCPQESGRTDRLILHEGNAGWCWLTAMLDSLLLSHIRHASLQTQYALTHPWLCHDSLVLVDATQEDMCQCCGGPLSVEATGWLVYSETIMKNDTTWQGLDITPVNTCVTARNSY